MPAKIEMAAEAMEEIYVPRDTTEDNPNLLIGINGKNWLLVRGETNTVPTYVAEEFRRAQKAQDKADRNISAMVGVKKAN